MTANEKRENQEAERNALKEVRSWKRQLSQELNKMSSAERVKYINDIGEKACAEHGIRLSYAN
ncbi:MAG: hypothetical protein Ta2G_11570 [Termitinemataceae bacterium]|nr:MAG: hypothetical protein Ta2G_11570 [Termitinemataceae bacterium]